MKKIAMLLVLFALLSFIRAEAQTKNTPDPKKTEVAQAKNGPVAKFDQTENNFGEIPQGIPKGAEFKLSNTGNEPLIIESAQPSCGCTNLKYEKDPILPGKTVAITATYNAANPGQFSKSITVRTNASDQPVILMIKGTVVPTTPPATPK
jgi:hypothetical protein